MTDVPSMMPNNKQLSDVNPETLKRLLSLLNGNTEATARLILAIRRKNPTATNQWHVEQAIKALESINRPSVARTTRFSRPDTWEDETALVSIQPPVMQYVDLQTKQLFIQMCSDHEPTAQRLVANIQHRYPDMSEQWCWEKAIEELKRDRL